MRTASLLPSATELVAAIGAEHHLVGRSHRCNHPKSVTDVPIVTQSTLEAQASPDAKDIDTVVDDHHHGGESYFRVHTPELVTLRPQLLITQCLCEVCAVPESMTTDAMERLHPRPQLVSLGPRTIDDILETITLLGDVLGYERAAANLIDELTARMDRVIARVRTRPERPRVVCLEWADPPRAHGLWIPDIIERLGAEDGFGEPGAHGRAIDWPDVLAYDPDVLIVSPCGRTIPEIRRDMRAMTGRSEWDTLSAVAEGRVYLLDGEISSRHGPRVVRSMELLAGMCYPGAFPDRAWSKDEALHFDPSIA